MYIYIYTYEFAYLKIEAEEPLIFLQLMLSFMTPRSPCTAEVTGFHDWVSHPLLQWVPSSPKLFLVKGQVNVFLFFGAMGEHRGQILA